MIIFPTDIYILGLQVELLNALIKNCENAIKLINIYSMYGAYGVGHYVITGPKIDSYVNMFTTFGHKVTLEIKLYKI